MLYCLRCYLYDVFGRRVAKTTYDNYIAKTTYYAYDGDRVVEELDGNHNVVASYVYGGQYIDEVVEMWRDAATGKPIPNFEISHSRGSNPQLVMYNTSNYTAFYNEEGLFSLTDVEAGEATIYARATGYGPATEQVSDVRPGEERGRRDDYGGLRCRIWHRQLPGAGDDGRAARHPGLHIRRTPGRG